MAAARVILHLDIDAFLASVEVALHPELRGRPVVVGGLPTDRNLVMSCSYEARARGVRPGMLLAEAARLCPEAAFRRGDAQAANALRERVVELVLETTPLVEVTSIDDLYADLTGTERALGLPIDVAAGLRARIRARVGVPVTIGLGSSRTLARLAGKVAKPGGVAWILPGYERAFLALVPVAHLPGCGHQAGRLLERFGVRTVGELALASREALFTSFGAHGLVLHDRARGIDRDPVEPSITLAADGTRTPRAPRSIRREGTFEPEEARREIVAAMLAYLVERAAHRLRAHHVRARTLVVRIQHVDTRSAAAIARAADPEPPFAEQRTKLDPPTDSTAELLARAQQLLGALPRRRALVKRVGLTLEQLEPAHGWQRHLLEDDGREARADRERRLDAALDVVRARHGFGRILRGASLPLAATHPLEPDGFRLRTPSLNQ
ncbi:MAG: DNA polymerase IV [Planctomycetes bacterium]|nr:DNA polymerase IV [Planctomycetota bacterium]